MSFGLMTARQKEEELLAKCLLAAQLKYPVLNAEDASVFIVASKLIRGLFPLAASRLDQSGAAYFSASNTPPIKAEEMVRSGLITDLPRFRHMLEQKMKRDDHVV